jgi:hypothetical protein
MISDLSYDVAVTATSNDKSIIFLKKVTFERMHVRSNYKVGFCHNMANYNDVKIRTTGDCTS